MLKACNLSLAQPMLHNKTCGEIICQSESSFFIICKLCDIKIFQYTEFVEHFRIIHWPEIRCSIIEGDDCAEEGNENEDFEGSSIVKRNINETTISNEVDIGKHYANDTENEEFAISDKEQKEKSSSIMTKFPQQQFECKQCSRTFYTKFYLNFHERKKHAAKDYKCAKCEESFVEELDLKVHQRSHVGYTCKQCGKKFEKYEALRYHQENHIESRDFICDYESCGKGFPNRRRLSAHRRYHFVQPLYVCEICGSRQRSKEFLTVHIRTHTGEKPFACTLCDRRFASKHFLKDHKAVHATEKPHVCDVCGKAFTGRKSLYHHRYLHTDVKKFVCKICERSYSQSAGLSAHMRKHKLNSGLLETS